MVELLRIEPKATEDTGTRHIATSAAESYRSFLKSRAVFAPVGDVGHRGGSGRSHSFQNRRYSEGKFQIPQSTDFRQENKPRRSHSSDNILEEVNRQQTDNVHDTCELQSAINVKRSKFEYIKQLFSKKPDKPKKYSAPSSPAPRSAYTFHRPSDVTSNYSTSDYASDQELDDSAFPKIRPTVHLNRNSKIASIVKRFEPNSPVHTENSRQLIDNPSTSEVIERTHSQALLDIQAISSDLSSLMTNISYLSSDKLAVNNTPYPHKQLVVETLLEPHINEDYNDTPKVTTSYSAEDKKQFDLTLDSCHSSEHGDDVLSLDDFLSNLTTPKLPHTRYARYSQGNALDSDTNTEEGSTVVDMTPSTDMEMTMESTLNESEIQHGITMDASVNSEANKDSVINQIQLNKPAYIDLNVNRDLVDMTPSTDMEMTMESTLNETEITMDASIYSEVDRDSVLNQIQLDRPAYIDLNSKLSSLDDRMTRIMQDLSTNSMDTSVRLPNLLPTHNSTNVNVNVNTESKPEIIPTENADFEVTSPTESEANTVLAVASPTNIPTTHTPTILSPVKFPHNTVPSESPSLQPRHAFSLSSDDVTSLTTDSYPHKHTGYSLPPGETRSVSDRIRSLLLREPIACAQVDKLSLARAAIERRKSEAIPAYLPARPVLLEIREPEEFSVRSLRDRFEVRMRQIEPSGVMLAPSQIPKLDRKKSEDLGIKPTFAGITKKLSSHDILAMQSEYNTDRDANRNKSLVQPKYTIK